MCVRTKFGQGKLLQATFFQQSIMLGRVEHKLKMGVFEHEKRLSWLMCSALMMRYGHMARRSHSPRPGRGPSPRASSETSEKRARLDKVTAQHCRYVEAKPPVQPRCRSWSAGGAEVTV